MKKRVLKFGIGGGPCSGKTSGLPVIAEKLRDKGYIALIVPEVDTLLKAGGLSLENLGNWEFQKANLDMQIRNEEIFERCAQILAEKENKDVIILCDRGKLCGAAYLPEFSDLLQNHYDTTAEKIHTEYVGILHLVTTAIGAEEYFTVANNSSRTEDIPHARELDYKSRNAWKGHPNIYIIENIDKDENKISFEQKIELCMRALYDMLDNMDANQSTSEVEFEAKAELTEEEYLKLTDCFHLNVSERVKQTNSFYDTDDYHLDINDITLRTRVKKGEQELTCKYAVKDSDGRPEINHRPLLTADMERLRNEGILPESNVKETITSLGFSGPFPYQGDLDTFRNEPKYRGCKIALDYNEYLGKHDYEIESEQSDLNADQKQVLLTLLAELNIPYRPSKAKRSRFFDEKRKQEKK